MAAVFRQMGRARFDVVSGSRLPIVRPILRPQNSLCSSYVLWYFGVMIPFGPVFASASPQPPTHWWQGASGHWYIHNIYSIHSIPEWLGVCNYLFARPLQNGKREPFYIGESGNFDIRISRHEKFAPALRLGATELHVHLLANTKQQRLDIETDLRNAHWTTLNAQPSRAASGLSGLAGLLPSMSGGLGALSAVPAPLKNYLAPAEAFSLADALSTNSPLDALLRSVPPYKI